jgi:hypothetical protein
MVGTEVGSKTFSRLLGNSAIFLCDDQIVHHHERLVELKATWHRTRPNGLYGITGIAAVDIEVAANIAVWGRLLDRPDLTRIPFIHSA